MLSGFATFYSAILKKGKWGYVVYFLPNLMFKQAHTILIEKIHSIRDEASTQFNPHTHKKVKNFCEVMLDITGKSA
jgi:hypothetical protein